MYKKEFYKFRAMKLVQYKSGEDQYIIKKIYP